MTDTNDIAIPDAQFQAGDVLDGVEGRSQWLVFVDATREVHLVDVIGGKLHLHIVPVGDNFHQLIQCTTIEEEVAGVPRGVEVDVHLVDVGCPASLQVSFLARFQEIFLAVLAAHTHLAFHQDYAGDAFLLGGADVELSAVVVYVTIGGLYDKWSLLGIRCHNEVGFSHEFHLALASYEMVGIDEFCIIIKVYVSAIVQYHPELLVFLGNQ